MKEFAIETKKIDKIETNKRLLCYYYLFYHMQKDMGEMWHDYEKLLEGMKNWIKYYEDFFANPYIKDEDESVEVYYLITGNEDTLLQNEIRKTWCKVKGVIKKEIDCEKKLRDILNNKAKDHPIISKIIIVILTGILLGLVEDCIHDAIQMNNGKSGTQITNIYISDENNNYTQILYQENNIVIEEIK